MNAPTKFSDATLVQCVNLLRTNASTILNFCLDADFEDAPAVNEFIKQVTADEPGDWAEVRNDPKQAATLIYTMATRAATLAAAAFASEGEDEDLEVGATLVDLLNSEDEDEDEDEYEA